jgi:hypothetical protein
MDEKSNEQKQRRPITRRRFVGTVGAAAVAASALKLGQSQDASPSQVYYYQDSFGNIIPVAPDLIALGMYPPPVPATSALPADAANPGEVPAAGTTVYNTGYPKQNILLIIVDQMRNPAFWLPAPSSSSPWWTVYNNTLPNITGLAKQWSYILPNYFVAATVCTPSRACLLTGLYSQQTSIFQTHPSPTPPPLLPYNPSWNSSNTEAGFPTIGNVLSQPLNRNNGYACFWIGKWHLSCYTTSDSGPGADGPSDYGFNSTYSIPTTNPLNKIFPSTFPSPNGVLNGGASGDFIDASTLASGHDVPNYGYSPLPLQYYNNAVMPLALTELNDAAIAGAFGDWLGWASGNLNGGYNNNVGLSTPWFCAVSFVNPHDICNFPWGYALVPTPPLFTFETGSHNQVTGTGYQPPPVTSSNTAYPGTNTAQTMEILSFPNIYLNNNNLPPGGGNNAYWNYEVLGNNKPGLQYYFQYYLAQTTGNIQSPGNYNASNNNWPTPTAWGMFLNYYVWLQSCVDYQVGQVLGSLSTSGLTTPAGLYQSPFNNNTLVIFTSDHGDFAGSHGLHDKGNALYDESLNVPLIISYPTSRNATKVNAQPYLIPYACSSVDLLPFLYAQALGSDTGWRNNSGDMVYYLANRESIFDAVYYYNNANYDYPHPGVQHRRISGISLHNNTTGSNAWQLYQPFVLHTTDEIPVAKLTYPQPSHAIALRTIDQTELNTSAAPFFGQNSYGGGKLGIYNFWDTVDAVGQDGPIVLFNTNSGQSNSTQFEFYNFSPSRNNGNANPQEVGNEYGAVTGSPSGLGLAWPYYTDFFNTGNNGGINIQNELFSLNNNGSTSNSVQQVQAAMKTAFNNYISYLECTNNMTGSNGFLMNNNNNTCASAVYTW